MLVLPSGLCQMCVAVWNHPGGGRGGSTSGLQKNTTCLCAFFADRYNAAIPSVTCSANNPVGLGYGGSVMTASIFWSCITASSGRQSWLMISSFMWVLRRLLFCRRWVGWVAWYLGRA